MDPGAYLDKEYKTDQDDGAAFFLLPGPEPSQGWITVSDLEAEAVAFKKEGHTLTFSDGTNELDIEHLYVIRTEDAGEGITRLILADLRYWWGRRYITRHYNQLNDDKETFNAETTKDGLTASGWTFREIVEDLLDALTDVPKGFHKPGTVYDKGKLDDLDTAANPILVDKSIVFASAGAALAEYLAQVGGTVHINFGGDIVITLPEEDNFSDYEAALDPAITTKTTAKGKPVAVDKPQYCQVKYAILREKQFDNAYWEPVMQHDGKDANGNEMDDQEAGEWLPVDDVLQDWGWDEEKIRNVYWNMDDRLNPDKEKWIQDHIEKIQREFYKYFRFKVPGTSSTEARTQILPFLDERGTHVEPTSGESWNTGIYCFETKVSYPVQVDNEKVLQEVFWPATAPRIADKRQGIIAFDSKVPVTECEQVGEGNSAEDFKLYEPSQIQIVLPFIKKFQDSSDLANDYYNAGGDDNGYADEWTGLPDNGDTHILIDESRFYVERDLTGTGSYTAYNQTEIDAVAEQAAEDFFRSFIKKEPVDIEIGTYNSDIDQLCGTCRSIHIYANAAPGYGIIYRLHDDAPLNEFAKNFKRDVIPDRLVGETISTRTPMVGFALGTGRNQKGITEIPTSYGRRSGGYSAKHVPSLINPQKIGVMVAEDFAKTAGGSDFDLRTKHTRITKNEGDRPEKVFTRKNAITPAWERLEWEAVLVTPSRGPSKPEEKPRPSTAGPVITPSPGQPTGPAQRAQMGGGGGLTVPVPRQPTNPGQAPKPKSGNESTYIFTETPEGAQAKKGPLRDVLMVGEHRYRGPDPDGHQICWAEIDKNTAMHHRNDRLCGPLIDSGEKLRPDPDGEWVYTEQIFDPRVQGWVYRTTVPVGGFGVPPEPTPDPPNPPPPPPRGPGGSDPVPTGGGGGGTPNSETPTLDPPPEFPPCWPNDDPSWPGTGEAPGWGTHPGGDDPGVPRPGPWENGNGQPIGSGDDPTPGPGGPGGGGGQGGPQPGEKEYNMGGGMGEGWAGCYAHNTDWAGYAAPLENRSRRMIPGNEPDTWWNQVPTPGTTSALSPYFPGSGVSDSLMHMAHRRSPFYPGTPPISVGDESTYSIDSIPSSHAWDDTTLSDERYSQSDYESQTFGIAAYNSANNYNTLHSRVETLDARDRANYNTQATVSLPAGDTTVDYSPSTVYSSAPTAQVTQAVALSTHDFGAISCTVTADGDGTYTFGIEVETSDPAAPRNFSIDIKGPVADSEDIDP